MVGRWFKSQYPFRAIKKAAPVNTGAAFFLAFSLFFLAFVCRKSVRIHEISEIVPNFQNLLDFRENFVKFRPNSVKISLKNSDFEQNLQSVTKISAIRQKLTKSADFRVQSGAKVCEFCRSRKHAEE